jgi:phosphoribosylformylglycinamidine cyclo-ligase
MSEAYRQAGVDTAAGQHFVNLIKPAVKSTFTQNVMGGLGGFSALYDVSFLKEYKEPVLVSSTDGVGTKLTLARLFNRHETIGLDLVAMCANDLLVTGARPLFFLDYIAVGRLQPEQMKIVVESIAAGCRLAHCSLVGGETAEHPGVMADEDYDLAGFIVGCLEKERLKQTDRIAEGDVIVGIPSSGIHSNGVSLVRKIFLNHGLLPSSEQDRAFLRDKILLAPTILYEEIVREVIEAGLPTGMVHITGGGFHENVPRVLPDDLSAEFTSWTLPEPFASLQHRGNLRYDEMLSVFNCGYGYLIMVREKDVERTLSMLDAGLNAYRKRVIDELETTFASMRGSCHPSESFMRSPAVIGRIKKKQAGDASVHFL